MKNKVFIPILIGVVIVTALVTFAGFTLLNKANQDIETQTVAVKAIGGNIVASGSVHSEQEATLHFQTGGKLLYLPVTQGQTVYQGQTIAQLDSYPLQEQLTAALNTYRSTRDTFDQTQENTQTGLYQNTEANTLNVGQAGLGNSQSTIINDMAKRIVDQNQANLDNSVISVQLANYALQLATLTSPFTGVLLSEDVTVPNQNITPTTGFTVIDPSQLVFRANVLASDIDYVTVGAKATVQISGTAIPFTGTVIKIYPQKMTLNTGDEVYQVDVQSDLLQKTAKYGQTGSVLIASNANTNSVVVPTWTIVGHNQVWVLEHNKPELKTVTIGAEHGDMTEVTSGLSDSDRVITNPKTIAAQTYTVL